MILSQCLNKTPSNFVCRIEKQRLVKFPDDADQHEYVSAPDKKNEAKRILQEIEKINQSLGYVKKYQERARLPTILDSSQYLFPNTGYEPYHNHNSQKQGGTLLVPSIRAVQLQSSDDYYHKASEFNKPPTKKQHQSKKSHKPHQQQHVGTKHSSSSNKHETHTTNKSKPESQPQQYFHPHRVELPAPKTPQELKQLPTHFVIPVRLYKHNKNQYIQKHNPQEYNVKGYKIAGDIDHFYGKTKHANGQHHHVHNKNKTPFSSDSSSTKYHLFFLPSHIINAKTSDNDIPAINGSAENSSREEKLANRPFKVTANSQSVLSGNTLNSTTLSQVVRKRLVPKPFKGGDSNSVISAASSSVIKVTPVPPTAAAAAAQQNNNQHQQSEQQQQQHQQFIKQQPTAAAAPTGAAANNIKNMPFLNLQNNLQNNLNNINNMTTTAIKTAFQNIFKRPFSPQQAVNAPSLNLPSNFNKPSNQLPQQQQQQHYQPPQVFSGPTGSMPIYGNTGHYQNNNADSDYRWEDESFGDLSAQSDDQDLTVESIESNEPAEKKLFGQPIAQMQETQKEAIRQGGIIIQKLKVRKGGIAIAGPGGVATAGSGGTAIVGPGGYALTHPRSLTIAGPGAKVIAIPPEVDLQDALTRIDLKTKSLPREGRIVATGPTIYYAPANSAEL